MKNLLNVLILFVCFNLSGQLNVEMSDPVSVTNGNDSFGMHHPRIVSQGDGNLIVFWSKGGIEPHLYMVNISNGVIDPVIDIPLGGVSPNIWGGGIGPEIAADENHIYVTMEVYGEAIYCIHSSDGGQSFESPVEAFVPPSDRRATEPLIEITSDGNPIISYINTNANEGDARYETVSSTDFGQTFLPPVHSSASANGAEVCECCPASMEVSGDESIDLAFRNNDDNLRDIWVVRSNDNGETFPIAIDLDQTNWTVSACPTSGPHILNTELELIATFYSGGNDFWDAGVYVGAIDNSNNSAEIVKKLPGIDGEGNLQNFPRIDGNDEYIGVVWQELYDGSMEVAFTGSLNGYEGLASHETVNLSNADMTQNYPDILFHNGQFHIAYEDASSNTVLYQQVTVSQGTGMEEAKKINYSLYPNPTQSQFVLEMQDHFENDMNLIVRDALGKIVMEQRMISPRIEVSMEQFENGLYSIELLNVNGSVILIDHIMKQ